MLKIDQEKFLDITIMELERIGATRIEFSYYRTKDSTELRFVNLEFHIGNRKFDIDYNRDGLVWMTVDNSDAWLESIVIQREGFNNSFMARSTDPLRIAVHKIPKELSLSDMIRV